MDPDYKAFLVDWDADAVAAEAADEGVAPEDVELDDNEAV